MNMVPHNGTLRGMISMLAIFIIALTISAAFFTLQNQRQHSEINSIERVSCQKDRQIAANQRRVLLSLIAMNQYLVESPSPTIQQTAVAILPRLYHALELVPVFDC